MTQDQVEGPYDDDSPFVEYRPGAVHYFVDDREVSPDEFRAAQAEQAAG